MFIVLVFVFFFPTIFPPISFSFRSRARFDPLDARRPTRATHPRADSGGPLPSSAVRESTAPEVVPLYSRVGRSVVGSAGPPELVAAVTDFHTNYYLILLLSLLSLPAATDNHRVRVVTARQTSTTTTTGVYAYRAFYYAASENRPFSLFDNIITRENRPRPPRLAITAVRHHVRYNISVLLAPL